MPMRGELLPISTRDNAQHSPTLENAWSRIAAVLGSRDLQAVAIFCAIGLLLTINAVLRFPDFGEAVAQLALFP